MKIGIFLNPFSGRTKYGFFAVERFKMIFEKHLEKQHIFEFVEAQSSEDIPKKIEYLLNFDIVAVVGGDGTLKNFVDYFIPLSSGKKEIPFIFPIGAGSLNVVQKNVFPAQTIGTAPRFICSIANMFRDKKEISAQFVRKVNVLRFKEAELIHYGFMFGNGVIYKAMQLYYERGGGVERSLLLMLELILSVISGSKKASHFTKFIRSEFVIDGKKYPHEVSLASLASVFGKMVLFTRPFIKKTLAPEEFFFAIYGDNPLTLVLNFFQIALGKKVLEKSFNGSAKKVQMYFEGGYTVDGEVFERRETEIDITVGPQILFLTLQKL